MKMGINIMVSQNGGPTQVINATLVGVIEAGQSHRDVDKVLVAKYGVRGARDNDFIDATSIPKNHLDEIALTPSSAAGSTRDKPDGLYCKRIVDNAIRNNIAIFFIIGGNDSADKARIISEYARSIGYQLHVWHIPKTIDNDLLITDHCPGYGSTARTVALISAGNSLDNIAIPGIKVDVYMGRHAGYITAASQLAMKEPGRFGPDRIYVPEDGAFDSDGFLATIDDLYRKQGRVYLAVAEGCTNDSIKKAQEAQEKDAHDNVQLSGTGFLADYLAGMIKAEIKPKEEKLRVRGDTLGYLQRSLPETHSPIDLREAREWGREAVNMAVGSYVDKSLIIEVLNRNPYQTRFKAVDLSLVAKNTKSMPGGYVKDHVITDAFREYVMPIIGTLPTFRTLI